MVCFKRNLRHLLLFCLIFLITSYLYAIEGADPTPEHKALRYLSREVPRWSAENRCYSCHNNGDAARALYDASRRLHPSAPAADVLSDTTRWLEHPDRWDRNGGEGPFSDKRLARIQFASALVAALDAGASKDRAALGRAAERLVKDQAADGFWPIAEGAGSLGSPAGYGRPLATLAARDVLRAADPVRHRESIARADRWLLDRPVASTIDPAVALIVAAEPTSRRRLVDRLRTVQGSDGGFGPFPDSPPEAFDTALALLALCRHPLDDASRTVVMRARAYLIRIQEADGSWPETTRPAGGESYAQRISTTGWATLALLASGKPTR